MKKVKKIAREQLEIAEAVFNRFYAEKGWTPFAFQREVFDCFFAGYSGLLNAPTGSGKTYALGLPVLAQALTQQYSGELPKGLKAIWISPIRALAPEIESSLKTACELLNLDWRIENRTGDTSAKDRARQKKSPPDFLITTPESLHILLSQKGSRELFGNLQCVVADEWHELLSTKRGVQVELALSRLRTLAPGLRTWGISATIGNLEEAAIVLLGLNPPPYKLIRTNIEKKTEVVTLLPEEIDKYPWAGHLGLKMLPALIPIINGSASTLVFTNTRGQAEIWYQALLNAYPDWAGQMALHHGSLDGATRAWVENALHEGKLKLVVCTSSLDLGVDFRPVETVVQIGSPKGVSRFAQRAGRSGHRPGETSRIYLLPTNSLELIEAAGMKEALKRKLYEERPPVYRAFDVLVQYLVTLAVGDGFSPDEIRKEVSQTFCYSTFSDDEWRQVLQFITTGGDTLKAYSEFSKVQVVEGKFVVEDKRTAMRHRLSIGTIASEISMSVTLMNGKKLGNIEEYFISKINPGDVFVYAGQMLELVQVRGTQAIVRKTTRKSKVVPSWNGGRMPLSNQISSLIREKLSDYADGDITDAEMEKLVPLLELQRERAAVPREKELLVEIFHSVEGHHYLFYPFEGRLVHEGMAMLLAYRLTQVHPASFSLGMNDYGFELLTDSDVDFSRYINESLFSTENLTTDIYASTNYTEIARRRFRDIASIAGLLFKGFPKKQQKTRHLQANSNLFYEVFADYDPDNFLLRQSLEEALAYQLEETRLRMALKRMQKQQLLMYEIDQPTPFSFPILVDSMMRGKFTNEPLEERVKRMIAHMQEG